MLWICCFIFFFPILVTAFEIFWRLASRRLWPCRISSVDQFHPHSSEIYYVHWCTVPVLWCLSAAYQMKWPTATWAEKWVLSVNVMLATVEGSPQLYPCLNGRGQRNPQIPAEALCQKTAQLQLQLSQTFIYIHGFKRTICGAKVDGTRFQGLFSKAAYCDKHLQFLRHCPKTRMSGLHVKVHLVSSWSLGHLLRPVLQRKLEISLACQSRVL